MVAVIYMTFSATGTDYGELKQRLLFIHMMVQKTGKKLTGGQNAHLLLIILTDFISHHQTAIIYGQ